jgi:hypothetical protein
VLIVDILIVECLIGDIWFPAKLRQKQFETLLFLLV